MSKRHYCVLKNIYNNLFVSILKIKQKAPPNRIILQLKVWKGIIAVMELVEEIKERKDKFIFHRLAVMQFVCDNGCTKETSHRMSRQSKWETSYLLGSKGNSGVIRSTKLLVYLDMAEEIGERPEAGSWKSFASVWWLPLGDQRLRWHWFIKLLYWL